MIFKAVFSFVLFVLEDAMAKAVTMSESQAPA